MKIILKATSLKISEDPILDFFSKDSRFAIKHVGGKYYYIISTVYRTSEHLYYDGSFNRLAFHFKNNPYLDGVLKEQLKFLIRESLDLINEGDLGALKDLVEYISAFYTESRRILDKVKRSFDKI